MDRVRSQASLCGICGPNRKASIWSLTWEPQLLCSICALCALELSCSGRHWKSAVSHLDRCLSEYLGFPLLTLVRRCATALRLHSSSTDAGHLLSLFSVVYLGFFGRSVAGSSTNTHWRPWKSSLRVLWFYMRLAGRTDGRTDKLLLTGDLKGGEGSERWCFVIMMLCIYAHSENVTKSEFGRRILFLSTVLYISHLLIINYVKNAWPSDVCKDPSAICCVKCQILGEVINPFYITVCVNCDTTTWWPREFSFTFGSMAETRDISEVGM